MRDLENRKAPFRGYIPRDRKEYHRFIRLILAYADSVCFTVKPFLDNLEEFNSSIWSGMKYSVLDHGFARAASNAPGCKSHLILLKKAYPVYDFLQSRNHIFDFTREDAAFGITLEDPAFIKGGEVFCYTVTHEKICFVAEDVLTEDVYRQLSPKECYSRKKRRK